MGDTVQLTTRHLLDEDGDPLTTQAQIIEAKDLEPGTSAAYQAEDLRLAGRYAVYTPDDIPDYPFATAAQRGRYGFYASDADEVGADDPAYLYL